MHLSSAPTYIEGHACYLSRICGKREKKEKEKEKAKEEKEEKKEEEEEEKKTDKEETDKDNEKETDKGREKETDENKEIEEGEREKTRPMCAVHRIGYAMSIDSDAQNSRTTPSCGG